MRASASSKAILAPDLRNSAIRLGIISQVLCINVAAFLDTS